MPRDQRGRRELPHSLPPTRLAVLPLSLQGGEGAAWGRGVRGAVAVV